MDSLWRITRDTFALFDPDRELDKVLERVRSHKIALVLRYWNNLRNGPRLPTRADIDPAAIKSAMSHTMITGISYQPFRVQYRLVGTDIVRWSRADFTHRFADELIFEGGGRDWTDYYRSVVDARRPGYGLSDWVEHDRAPQWVETIICPLSSDGQVIDRCLAIEDYQPMSRAEVELLPPLLQRSGQRTKRASE